MEQAQNSYRPSTTYCTDTLSTLTMHGSMTRHNRRAKIIKGPSTHSNYMTYLYYYFRHNGRPLPYF